MVTITYSRKKRLIVIRTLGQQGFVNTLIAECNIEAIGVVEEIERDYGVIALTWHRNSITVQGFAHAPRALQKAISLNLMPYALKGMEIEYK